MKSESKGEGRIFERMRNCRAQIAPNDSQERFESLGVDVFRGQAKFLSPDEVQVGDEILRAKNFVIATGSRATIPNIAGIETVKLRRSSTNNTARIATIMSGVGEGPHFQPLLHVSRRFKLRSLRARTGNATRASQATTPAAKPRGADLNCFASL